MTDSFLVSFREFLSTEELEEFRLFALKINFNMTYRDNGNLYFERIK